MLSSPIKPSLLRFAAVDLQAGYTAIRDLGEELSGKPADMAQRAFLNHVLYRDSKGNFAFPQLVCHGGLWAKDFFDAPHGKLGKAISYRYFYSRKERENRLALLQRFSNTLQEANRQVFVDTFTNYAFTKLFGKEPGAENYMNPEILTAFNAMHEAIAKDKPLTAEQQETLYKMALNHEQRDVIEPVLGNARQNFDCPILKTLIFKPVVHLAFFPRFRFFFYRNFANLDERINRGIKAFHIARQVGWEKVISSLSRYKHWPRDFAEKTKAAQAEISARLQTIARRSETATA